MHTCALLRPILMSRMPTLYKGEPARRAVGLSITAGEVRMVWHDTDSRATSLGRDLLLNERN